nr:hypothetical protein [Tanacetum cinerariifolium]
WWEKSDWSGYKELGVEKSGRNAEADSWWETWREVLHQDEWRQNQAQKMLVGMKIGGKNMTLRDGQRKEHINMVD